MSIASPPVVTTVVGPPPALYEQVHWGNGLRDTWVIPRLKTQATADNNCLNKLLIPARPLNQTVAV